MIKTNIKPNMHLERQTLSEVHIFIGIYFEEEADGLMKERRGRACYCNSSGCYCCVGCAHEKEKSRKLIGKYSKSKAENFGFAFLCVKRSATVL